MKKRLTLIVIIVLLLVVSPYLQYSIKANSNVKIGDYVQFGSYGGKPILWRVINIDSDGDPLLFADKIISFKAYDSPKGSGSSFWVDSNIRQWLNSSQDKIKWIGDAPSSDNLGSSEKAYDNEAGFLSDNNFTETERRVIKSSTHKVILSTERKDVKDGGNEAINFGSDIIEIASEYDNIFYKNVTDKVFLLSVKELKDYVYDRGWNISTLGTTQALEKQGAYAMDNPETYSKYWTRTPIEYNGSDCLILTVNERNELITSLAYLESIGSGVRPAMYISSSCLKYGLGSETEPYTMSENEINNVEKKEEVSEDKKEIIFQGIDYTKSASIRVFIDGKQINFDVKPQIIDGRTLVPMRKIFEATGLTVNWDSENKKATGTDNNNSIIFTMGEKQAVVNNLQKNLDVAPSIINGRTMIPLRFLSENLGYNVVWNGNSNLILLSKSKIVEWKYGGYENVAPYKEYEIKYINGEKTELTRYNGKTHNIEFKFKGIKWGTDKSGVKGIENETLIDENDTALLYYSKVINLDANLLYHFNSKGKLSGIMYDFEEFYYNDNNYIYDYIKIKDELIKKYGEPSIDQVYWQNDLFKDDPENYGLAVAAEHLSYYCLWELPDTKILLTLEGKDFECELLLYYGSNEYSESQDYSNEL